MLLLMHQFHDNGLVVRIENVEASALVTIEGKSSALETDIKERGSYAGEWERGDQ